MWVWRQKIDLLWMKWNHMSGFFWVANVVDYPIYIKLKFNFLDFSFYLSRVYDLNKLFKNQRMCYFGDIMINNVGMFMNDVISTYFF